ncbi:hypothetical protein [Rhodoferax sp.]|uniref:hypothetical protein n=1 Tax=Rhodoferax sp. TaxID=50421 RepID=UPI00275BF42A|nr:hypothetical protein [Rhodoferax sp.]
MTPTSNLPHSNGWVQRCKNRVLGVNRLFLLTVVLPTGLAGLYYGSIASDVYTSESRFVVRSPERQSASPLGALFKGSGFSRSQDDSYTVQDFMQSRDALKKIDEQHSIGKAFASTEVDRLSRFAGLDGDDSFEALHLYYKKKIDIQLDSSSSISTLSVRAFTAEDAYRVNAQLLDMSEALVNQLNARGRQDMIQYAATEVADAAKKAKVAGLALARYRNEKGVIDPEKQAAIPLQQIAKLQDELISTKFQILQLEKIAKNNAQLPLLRQRAQLLGSEIKAETLRVVGGGDRSLASKATEYQRLAMEKEFADKMLASTMVALEQARSEAQRKQLYLERIVQPSKPDAAMEPRRLRAVLTVFVLGLIAMGILSMLITGIKEHQD